MAKKIKDKAVQSFQSFLDRLAASEVFTRYQNPKMTKNADEIIFTADGVDEQAEDDPWTTFVVWKKGSGNLFYHRKYKDGGYQAHPSSVRAKGDESLPVLLTKLLSRIKKSS